MNDIKELLGNFSHPGAKPYQPENATLFIRPLGAGLAEDLIDWPLDAKWLSNLDFGERGMVAVPLKGEMLVRYIAASGRNTGNAFFRQDKDYAAFLVPWLPGVDFTAAVQSEYPIPEIPHTNSHSTINCREIEPPSMGQLRLTWIQEGDLWVWDRGSGEPYSLTGSGDVSGVRLAPDKRTILYTLEAFEGYDLAVLAGE